MKPSSRRLGILLLVWICVIAGLLVSDALEEEADESFDPTSSVLWSGGSGYNADDSDDPYAHLGLRPTRLHHMEDADLLREALVELLDDASLDVDAVPLFVDEDSNVWVEHNHEFYALVPADPQDDPEEEEEEEDAAVLMMDLMTNAVTEHILGRDSDTGSLVLDPQVLENYIMQQQQIQGHGHTMDTMAQAVNNLVQKLFQAHPQHDQDHATNKQRPAASTLAPSEIEALERKVLVEFFTSAAVSWARVDDESKHVCQFRGVLCEHRITSHYHFQQSQQEPPVYQVVTRLEMTNANLQTTLPPNFADLRHLTVINLAGNRLHGTIPQTYTNMSYSLSYLDFGENNLTGTVPEHFLATSMDLQEIRLNHNSLSGKLLRGSDDWEALKVLDMADNFLSGTIPSELALLPNLQYLVLGNNLLTGTIPSEFSELNYMYSLDAGSNFIDDSLDHILQVLPSRLLDINLEDNFIHGTISNHLFEPAQLELLLLSHNRLTGTLPEGSAEGMGWSDLHNLRALHLTDNRLTGTLPSGLFTGLKSSLASLTLGQNRFTGTIPTEIGELDSLFIIDAMSNQLRGTLPTTMLQLNRNLRFNFTNNLITGTIPGLFCGEGATSTSMLYQENGCDAVLCRAGTFNIHGHATLHTCCRECPLKDSGETQDPPVSRILGRTHCDGLEYVHGDLDGDGLLSPREVLRMIYIDTLGRFWGPHYQKWANMTCNECDLEGVTCVKGRVTKLDLTNANMCSDGNRKPGPISYCKGIPAEIGELKTLEVLQLSRRQFFERLLAYGDWSPHKFALAGCLELCVDDRNTTD